MDPARPSLGLPFFRATTLLLLAVVVGLGWSLGRTLDERSAAVSQERPAPAPARPPATPPATAAPAAPSVTVTDLGADVVTYAHSNALTNRPRAFPEAAFGGLRYIVLGPAEILPLHLHRVMYETLVPVAGKVEVRGGKAGARLELDAAKPALLSVPPYAPLLFANTSKTEPAFLLGFRSPPRESDTFIDPASPPVPATATTESALHALPPASSTGADSVRNLVAMGGTLTARVVAGEWSIPVGETPVIGFVVSGAGRILEKEAHPVAKGGLFSIQGKVDAKLVADAGTPLTLVVLQPPQGQVSDILLRGKKVYSQIDEELVIRDFFQDRREGVFLDVGSAHYQDLSTTYYLEERLGWSGVAVDALPDYAAGYAKHRPKTRFVNYLITDKPRGVQKFFRAPKYLELSSATKAVAQEQERLLRGSDAVEELDVPSITLDELLAKMGVTSLDFMSLDIEEHEPQALAGFDIERHRPKLVCVEAHTSVRDEVYAYFVAHGYERLDKYLPYDTVNWYFAPKKR